jgi:Fe-S cluster assembly iron-binding protein IscA
MFQGKSERPRKDSKYVTDTLAPQRLAHLAALKKPKTVLRLNVLSGGCHGFEYTRELVAESSLNLGGDGSGKSVDRLAGGSSGEEAEEEPVLDTVFEAEDGTGAKVVVDQTSLELLKGATVDYTIELMGSEFVVTDIPGASSSCGCGTSFSLKI